MVVQPSPSTQMHESLKESSASPAPWEAQLTIKMLGLREHVLCRTGIPEHLNHDFLGGVSQVTMDKGQFPTQYAISGGSAGGASPAYASSAPSS